MSDEGTGARDAPRGGHPGTGSELFLLGLSHRTADVHVRERCALAGEALRARLGELRDRGVVEEVLVVSTCNRTEAVVVASSEALDSGAAEGVVRHALFRDVPSDCLYEFRGVEAAIHLFRVTAGLDSMVLGESQILAQVKQAVAEARSVCSIGRTLEPLMERALVCGKRVRAETEVGAGTLSVARAGVSIAQHVVGRLEEVTALVVGAGETARLVARHLTEQRIGRLHFVNRSVERAHEAAASFGGEGAGLERLGELFLAADLVVACVDGAQDLLAPGSIPLRDLAHRDRPLVVIDLSVPRALHPELAEHDQVFAYDLDDVSKLVDTNQRARQRASEEAAPILVAEVHKFLSLRTYAAFSPKIARLRDSFESVREQELDAIAGAHASGDMVRLAHRLTKHLLDIALGALKESARDSVEASSLDRAYQRYLREQ